MKFSYIVKLAGIVLIGAVLSQPSAAKDKVYTWTDAKGTVHFGERPPKDMKATLVKTRTGHSEPTPAQAAAAQPKTTVNSTAVNQPTSLKDPERCARARENLTMLNSVARIKIQNADGVAVFLTEEDKVQQREISQRIIDQACE
jgi:hypothetical protein